VPDLRVALVYQRLGRRPPAPGPARERPPQAAPIAAPYQKRLRAFWAMWRAVVETHARRELAQGRQDARAPRPPRARGTTSLDDAFDSLLSAAGVGETAALTARRANEATARYTERVTKIEGFGLATRDTALRYAEDEFRKLNVSLITNLRDDHVERVQNILRPAVTAGRRWEDVAKSLERELGISERRARLIARDQTNKIVSDMARLHMQAAGVEEYTWRTSKDDAVRGKPGGEYEDSDSNHWKLEGKRFRWNDPPVTNDVTGERNHPGQDIQCRCTAEPVLPDYGQGDERKPKPKPRARKR
jgi:SPP1 gp7 family putative phage head morphogenesis protein